MKYKEFSAKVFEMGCNVTNDRISNSFRVLDHLGNSLIIISKKHQYKLTTHFDFRHCKKWSRGHLLDLAVELAKTPLEEREEEKCYRLKIPLLKDDGYLNLCNHDGLYELSTKGDHASYKNVFTESEIADLRKENNLDSFELEEVEEDE